MAFAHLHLHTEYSLLDGACRIKDLFSYAKELGQTAVAITDHGAMYGVIDFYRAGKAAGIKPVIGCEVYVAARRRQDMSNTLDSERYHLVLLCENNKGYQNLMKIVSEAWVSGFYTKPRIDKELLEKYHEGLIALSACLAGEIPRALSRGDYEEAKRTALWYRDLFGEQNYFIEIQNHGLDEQLRINPLLIRLSKETGIPLVATNDTHYLKKEDARTQSVLICIQTNHVLGDGTAMEFGTDEFYFKSERDMLEVLPECPDAIQRTAEIAERCNIEIEFGNTKLPHFEVPDGKKHFDFMREICYKGLRDIFADNIPEGYIDRLEFELEVINKMGYIDYFLIVYDFIRYAKSKNIPVGPGRGSGAGSIAAYCMGITGIDPIRYNLLFERFLNPERVSMPDFDIDFCYVRRPEVIEYVIEKYGADHVAQIVTFGTMAAKAAIRDVGRALGIPYSTVDAVAKKIPYELGTTIQKALERSPEFKSQYESGEQIKDLIDTARKLEGMPRHASTHAAGVVITRDRVFDYVPLARNDESIVTQFTMTTLEELGLLKMDFLGLRTLTVISDAEKMIKEQNPDFSVSQMDIEDAEVYEMLSKGLTDGVFQFESAGMRSVLMGLRPQSLEDIIAVISLYRPGPMDSIPTYIENRHSPEKTKYATPMLREILEVTYGCMIYQEQVMQIFRTLAGYSYGRADIVRRAMSKKKHDVMQKEREIFIHGCLNEKGEVEVEGAVRRGVDEKTADKIFNEMSSFASYAFNKSHAAAYAVVAYQTAWLKHYYPCEFMAALLSSFLEDSSRISGYIVECQRLGLKVMPPHVNRSVMSFTVTQHNIQFGLLAVKNIGRGFIQEIIDERTVNGEFKTFYSFCKRLHGKKDFNKRAIESLIKCGALDELGASRRQMMLGLIPIVDDLDVAKRKNVEGQLGFFDVVSENDNIEPSLPKAEEFTHAELLEMERETTGIYISGHPMKAYEDISEYYKSAKINMLLTAGSDVNSEYKDNANIILLAMITSIKKKVTKSNTIMAFLTVEDIYGQIEVLVFPKTLEESANIIREGAVVLIRGRLSLKEDEDAKIVCESISFCPENRKKLVSEAVDLKIDETEIPPPVTGREQENKMPEETKQNNNKTGRKTQKLFLRFESSDDENIIKAEKLLRIFEGNIPVVYYFCDTKKYDFRPNSEYISLNEILLKELRNILGDENVISK